MPETLLPATLVEVAGLSELRALAMLLSLIMPTLHSNQPQQDLQRT